MKSKLKQKLLTIILATILLFSCGCVDDNAEKGTNANSTKGSVSYEDESLSNDDTEEQTVKSNSINFSSQNSSVNTNSVGTYKNKAYVTVNGNIPMFSKREYTTTSFERYSNLDSNGRCGVAYACIGKDLMPTGERGAIGQVKPSGWHTVKYDCVDGKYLYNRCHLIGWQLTAENANTKNLITGTRYLNISGMLPFENMVADYIKETSNHVLYRVTPDFHDNELVARGVYMEAYSIEDNGAGICFYVYCYNVQPGVIINYSDGISSLSSENSNFSVTQSVTQTATQVATSHVTQGTTNSDVTYIGNKNTKKFHKPSCGSASSMNEDNKVYFHCSRDEVVADGYVPCKNCNP